MRGRTMYVVPFSMGPLGSPIAHIGVELTDSPYVAVNMRIMTRMGKAVYDVLGDRRRVRALRAHRGRAAAAGPEGRAWPCNKTKYIVHYPETREIWSYGSGYGGNALLGKKCFALRIASTMGRDEGWLAEHMLILGVTNARRQEVPRGRRLPQRLRQDQLRDADAAGRLRRLEGHHHRRRHRLDQARRRRPLRAINPEAGYFGVAPGTNTQTNPNCMASLDKRRDLHQRRADRRRRRLVGGHDRRAPPAHLIDWQGKDWTPQIAKETGAKAAHPNARFTVAATNNPALDPDWDDPGRADRRLHLRRPPLHHRAAGDRGPQLDRGRLHGRHHGLRDHRRRRRPAGRGAPRPVRHAAVHAATTWRLLPALADLGSQARKRSGATCRASTASTGSARAPTASSSGPATARTCACWKWMLDRIEGKAGGTEHVFGVSPRYEDLNWTGLDFSAEQFQSVSDYSFQVAGH
jgi:phosphoenolpyruvate carboxykinase (GTP)